jgi:hypothetical protein
VLRGGDRGSCDEVGGVMAQLGLCGGVVVVAAATEVELRLVGVDGI